MIMIEITCFKTMDNVNTKSYYNFLYQSNYQFTEYNYRTSVFTNNFKLFSVLAFSGVFHTLIIYFCVGYLQIINHQNQCNISQIWIGPINMPYPNHVMP